VTDRVSSDHESVRSIRATLERVGRTDRLKVAIPADATDALPAGEVVRLALDGSTYHSLVDTDFDGNPELQGAYDSPGLARDGGGTDRLAEWVAETGLSAGSSVLLDVVTPEFKYGLRTPGDRTVYDATAPPDDSLSAIASNLDE
jgi:hypothetical protein